MNTINTKPVSLFSAAFRLAFILFSTCFCVFSTFFDIFLVFFVEACLSLRAADTFASKITQLLISTNALSLRKSSRPFKPFLAKIPLFLENPNRIHEIKMFYGAIRTHKFPHAQNIFSKSPNFSNPAQTIDAFAPLPEFGVAAYCKLPSLSPRCAVTSRHR